MSDLKQYYVRVKGGKNPVYIKPICVRIERACEILGIGRSQIYRLINDGKIKKFNIGTSAFIKFSEIEKHMSRLAIQRMVKKRKIHSSKKPETSGLLDRDFESF